MGLKKMAAEGHLRRRQAVLLLLAMVAALVLSSGMALAATITCQVNVECIGTPEPDTLEGTAESDHIYGRGDNDILRGRALNDYLYGQGGSDKLLGGPGGDSLFGGPGDDALNGGADYDYYFIPANNWGKDSISDSSADGSSLYFAEKEGSTVTDNLTITLFPGAGSEVKNASDTGTINWESATLIKNVHSGAGDDNITGNFLGNTINGGQGEDTISSSAGNDFIYVADGEEDHVDCGNGLLGTQDHDYVEHDSLDVVSDNCEQKVLET